MIWWRCDHFNNDKHHLFLLLMHECCCRTSFPPPPMNPSLFPPFPRPPQGTDITKPGSKWIFKSRKHKGIQLLNSMAQIRPAALRNVEHTHKLPGRLGRVCGYLWFGTLSTDWDDKLIR